MKKVIPTILAAVMGILFMSCPNPTVDSPKSGAKAITAFDFASPAATGIVTEATHSVEVIVPVATNLTALVPTIAISPHATISPSSDVATNFTTAVTYTVTAEDGGTQAYSVTVINPPKTITAFGFSSPAATGVINATAHTITVTVPYGTDETALVPTIAVKGANVSPASGVAHNFHYTNQVYTVTATDGTTQAYAVTVTVALNPAKAITSFSIAGAIGPGNITEATHSIAVVMPYGTDISSLIPTITQTGANISPVSGLGQNFTSPVTYSVTAADATVQTYIVTVSIHAGDEVDLAGNMNFSNARRSDGAYTTVNPKFGSSSFGGAYAVWQADTSTAFQSLLKTDTFTIEWWMRIPASAGSGTGSFALLSPSASPGAIRSAYWLTVSTTIGHMTFSAFGAEAVTNDFDYSVAPTGTFAYADNSWVHLAMTASVVDGSSQNVAIYANGIYLDSKYNKRTGLTADLSPGLWLGKTDASNKSWLHGGAIANMRISNKTRSAVEIAADAMSPTGHALDENTFSLWRFE